MIFLIISSNKYRNLRVFYASPSTHLSNLPHIRLPYHTSIYTPPSLSITHPNTNSLSPSPAFLLPFLYVPTSTLPAHSSTTSATTFTGFPSSPSPLRSSSHNIHSTNSPINHLHQPPISPTPFLLFPQNDNAGTPVSKPSSVGSSGSLSAQKTKPVLPPSMREFYCGDVWFGCL